MTPGWFLLIAAVVILAFVGVFSLAASAMWDDFLEALTGRDGD